MIQKYKELDENKKNIIQIIIALSALILFIIIRLIIDYGGNNTILRQEKYKKEIVKDNSRYYTVIGCINKYLTYVQMGNSEDILLLLDEEYKNNFNITSSNLKNYIPSLENVNDYSYIGHAMYSKRLSESISKYYVEGEIKKDRFMGDIEEGEEYIEEDYFKPEYIDYDFTVTLYENKFIFSIKPGVSET